MSHPSPDLPDHRQQVPPSFQPTGQEPHATPLPDDPFSFKVPAGALLIILGALMSLAAFTQVLTDLIFAPWYSLLLSMAGLGIALSVTAAGVLMLWRRTLAERLTPLAGIISTGALLAFLVVTQLIFSRGLSGLLLPALLSIPIFVLVVRGLTKTRHLMPPRPE